MNGLPKLLTVHEVAAYLGHRPKTITAWIRAGDIPRVKIGRHWFIIEDDLREYMTARSAALLARVPLRSSTAQPLPQARVQRNATR
jgi:excisionase family DNA binding protein